MISLSEVCSTRAKIDVAFGDEKMEVWHNPSVFTTEFELKIREDRKNEIASEFLVQTLSTLLHSWDLVDDEGLILGEEHKGEVVPTDAATLRRVPVSILIAVSLAIAENQGSETTNSKNVAEVPTPSGSFS